MGRRAGPVPILPAGGKSGGDGDDGHGGNCEEDHPVSPPPTIAVQPPWTQDGPPWHPLGP